MVNIEDIEPTSNADITQFIHDLKERIKELSCLYSISEIFNNTKNIGALFTETVKILPKAWQYPEITMARIIFEGQDYRTENFKESQWRQRSEIKINGTVVGAVEIFYSEKKPENFEGPFLKEERALIDNIAEQLERCIKSIRAEDRFLKIRQLVGSDSKSLSDLYSPTQNTEIDAEDKDQLLTFLDCVANRERLQILDHLRQKSLSVSELGQLTEKSHSTISHHLKQMEQFHIISGVKKGKFTYYSLVKDKIDEYIMHLRLWFDSGKNWI